MLAWPNGSQSPAGIDAITQRSGPENKYETRSGFDSPDRNEGNRLELFYPMRKGVFLRYGVRSSDDSYCVRRSRNAEGHRNGSHFQSRAPRPMRHEVANLSQVFNRRRGRADCGAHGRIIGYSESRRGPQATLCVEPLWFPRIPWEDAPQLRKCVVALLKPRARGKSGADRRNRFFAGGDKN
jgi:hypothetical protein